MSKQDYPLSKNLKKLREQKGLSQDRLAKRADVANNTIIKIEQGENMNPTLDTLKKITKAFFKCNFDATTFIVSAYSYYVRDGYSAEVLCCNGIANYMLIGVK